VTGARPRVDGPAKVTGAARYAAEWQAADLRHAALVTSPVPAATITAVDTSAAERVPGVVAVFTHHNAPRLRPPVGAPYGGRLPLQDNRVHYEGEPVAVVVAERLEQAREAVGLVRVDYAPLPAETDFRAVADTAVPTPPARWGPADTTVGDLAAGIAEADVVLRAEYSTAARHHSPIETSATQAEWRDGVLTLRDATQGVFNVRAVVSSALDLPADRVRVLAEYTGGGFGSKGYVWPHQVIAAMLARELGGALRLVLTRAQSFTSHGYQPPTRQRLVLAATAEGRFTAIRHDSLSPTSTYGEYVEMTANGSRVAYACPAITTTHRVAPVATVLPTPMRAPHEGPGMFALEVAVDEVACELGIDPLELRLRNHAEVDPTSGNPFSAKGLLACYAEGARRFGWADRPRAAGSLREGDQLIGWGMATAVMATMRFPAAARTRLHADGRVVVEAGCQEIGTGTYTIMPQLAAEVLGCPPEQVVLRLGDTALPRTGMTAGSSTTLSVGSAVTAAAEALAARLALLATGDPTAAVRLDGAELTVKNGAVEVLRLDELFARLGVDSVAAEGSWEPRENQRSMHTFGAVFAEVAVDVDLPVPRVRRLVAVYSAGRIVNPLTARGQMTGGLVWGIGQALLEKSTTDHRLGRFVDKNLAGYRLPVNADVPDLDVAFVEEYDPHASGIGARGIGELGSVGVAPAIANAVHHATGKRVRSLPIALEDLL